MCSCHIRVFAENIPGGVCFFEWRNMSVLPSLCCKEYSGDVCHFAKNCLAENPELCCISSMVALVCGVISRYIRSLVYSLMLFVSQRPHKATNGSTRCRPRPGHTTRTISTTTVGPTVRTIATHTTRGVSTTPPAPHAGQQPLGSGVLRRLSCTISGALE